MKSTSFWILFLGAWIMGLASGATLAPSFKCPTPSGFYPISNSTCTSSYYGCVDGVAYLLDCPVGPNGEAYLFDPKTLVCEKPADVSCKEQVFNCTENGFFAIENCLPVYYLCAENVAYEKKCPEGSVYDSLRKACTSPENCGATTTTSSTASTPTTPSTTTRGTGTTTTGIPGPFTCPLTDGKYPDPFDCNTYHVCVSGVDYPSYCNPDVCFNPATGQCDG